jgi:hypothetical protein
MRQILRRAALFVVVAIAAMIGYLVARLVLIERRLDGLAHRLAEEEANDATWRNGDSVRGGSGRDEDGTPDVPDSSEPGDPLDRR